MNLVQEKVKQRNITPNFLRFRSTLYSTQEKVPPILSAKRYLVMIESNHNLLPNEHKEAPAKPVDVALKPTNQESFILASSVRSLLTQKIRSIITTKPNKTFINVTTLW